jgi:hypothetical protein
MSSSIKLTLNELRAAAAWAEKHVKTVHAGELPYADIRVFHLPTNGIISRAVVLCEACDRVRVSDTNHHDVTDYNAA